MDADRDRNSLNDSSAQANLWSTILDSVAAARGVLTKNLVVLGTPSSGKSTLISRLTSKNGEQTGDISSNSGVLDLGLCYSTFDVGDDADEVVARLGLYQLPSPEAPYPSLLPLALSKETILDSLVLIVLDWARPWKFLIELENWLLVLHNLLEEPTTRDSWQAQEGRERLESHLRHYVEPGVTSSAQLAELDTSLPPGTLSMNLGVGVVIVCTKADNISTLEREKEFTEEQFDYIQQSLRTIALKYGAGLFFTSHSRPESFSRLRAYLLHRLFAQAPSTTAQPTGGSSRVFPFTSKANVVDRDQVIVPTGWDSWGKIKILRERFDPQLVGSSWDQDIENLTGKPTNEDRVDSHGKKIPGIIKMYEEMIDDLEKGTMPINMGNTRVDATDEQEFLQSHYEVLQKEREKDPRAAFASKSSNEFGASIVGPMASTSFSMPVVDRVLDQDEAVRRAKTAVRKDGVIPPSRSAALLQNASLGNTLNSTLPSASNGTAAGVNPQTDVLATFFQSLLDKRATSAAARPTLQSLANSTSPRQNNTIPAVHRQNSKDSISKS